MKNIVIKLKFLVLILLLTGCATTQEKLLETNTSQVKLRSIQTRAFDTTDIKKMMRCIILTLQDLGFVLDKADLELGIVSATKLNKYDLRMTITVRPRGKSQLLVRANAQYEMQAIKNPLPYQNFFTSLSKSIFLEAHQIE